MDVFEANVRKLLSEIPYVDYIGKFDLEIEIRQDVREFLNFLNDTISGKTQEDKHGNVITLQTMEEKKFFVNNILQDQIFKNWVNRQTPANKKMLGDFFKIIGAKLAIMKPRSAYY